MKKILTNQNYAAKIIKIENIRKHAGADRLQITSLQGNNLILDLSTKLDDVMVYFPIESQLSEEYAAANKLVKFKDENGKTQGYFESHRRVKCLKLRGEASEGYLSPISSLDYLGNHGLKIGDEFNALDSHLICEKYINPKLLRENKVSNKSKKPVQLMESRLFENQFRLHLDTSQLARNSHKFTPNTLISVTEKLHGTSFIISNCLTRRPLKFYEHILKALGVKIDEHEYDLIYSSRRVVGNAKRPKFTLRNLLRRPKQGSGAYYAGNLYEDISKLFRDILHAGETVYGEAVGYTKSGQAIQKNYDYGCNPGEFKIYIYRITKTGLDGKVHEYSFPQLKARCNQLGLNHVPEVFYGRAIDFYNTLLFKQNIKVFPNDQEFGEEFTKAVKAKVDSLGKCKYSKAPKAQQEGYCIRLEEQLELQTFKCKQFSFLQHETEALDSGNSEDMEENQPEDENLAESEENA